MLRETGSIRVESGPSGSSGLDGDILRQVMAAVADEYEILGEMRRGMAGTILFLAREVDASQLALLRLAPATDGDGSVLTVVRELDAGTVTVGETCGECGATLGGEGGRCPRCGDGVSKGARWRESQDSPVAALDVARSAAAGRYEIFGTLPRAGGAGVVYFARVLATGSLVALSLRDGTASSDDRLAPSLQVIQLLRSLTRPRSAEAAPVEAVPVEAVPVGAVPVEAVPVEVVPVEAAPAEAPAASGDPPAAQQPRAQPTPHRAAPPQVLIPAEDAPPDENLPPRPVPRIPPWWAAPAALVAVAVVALAAFAKARASMPDGTDARIGSGRMGVATAVPDARAGSSEPRDSAHIRVAATLPAGAEVTVDGVAISGEAIALLPGEYLLVASAPGHVSVSETVSAEAGQTIVWTPTLASTPAPVRPRAARRNSAGARSPTEPGQAAPATVSTRDTAPPRTASCIGAFNEKNWALAASLCANEARDGNVGAQRSLGAMYDRGLGIARDPARAATWLHRAADAGSRDAAYQLATMLESGRGVERDSGRAIAWYGKAALLGDRESQVKLGKAYEQGVGVPRDMGEALIWYRKAANQGDAWAQNHVGFLYGNGKGVRRDDLEALRWFRKSAAQGNGQAEYNVGFMYEHGRGVARSETEAITWYRKAAAHGYAEAEKELERRGVRP